MSKLFDGQLYGELDLERAGKESKVALPPYFPVDRNEAFIATGTPDLPANAVSKYLGLAWRLHRREVLPVLERIAPHLRAPELQQAADDILERMNEPETAELVADMARRTTDPVHQRELFALLARRLAGEWNAAHDRPKVLQVIEQAAPESRDARSRGSRWRPRRATGVIAGRSKASPRMPRHPRRCGWPPSRRSARSASRPTGFSSSWSSSVRGKPSSNSVAEAAVRAMAQHSGAQGRLTELLTGA